MLLEQNYKTTHALHWSHFIQVYITEAYLQILLSAIMYTYIWDVSPPTSSSLVFDVDLLYV